MIINSGKQGAISLFTDDGIIYLKNSREPIGKSMFRKNPIMWDWSQNMQNGFNKNISKQMIWGKLFPI